MQPAKASLAPQVAASALQEPTLAAIRKGHQKVAAAADVLHLSESHLGRLAGDGDLKVKQLAALGPEVLAEFGRQLVEHYGPMAVSPQEQIERHLDAIQSIVNEIRQGVRHLAA
jgi:hypothetical protein